MEKIAIALNPTNQGLSNADFNKGLENNRRDLNGRELKKIIFDTLGKNKFVKISITKDGGWYEVEYKPSAEVFDWAKIEEKGHSFNSYYEKSQGLLEMQNQLREFEKIISKIIQDNTVVGAYYSDDCTDEKARNCISFTYNLNHLETQITDEYFKVNYPTFKK